MLRGSGRYAPATPPLLATRPGKSRGLWKVRVAAESCYCALDGVSVVGWRSLHALPSTSACWRRQAASRHERLAAFASRSKTRQRSFGRRSGCLAFPVSNNQGNPLGRGTDVIFSTSPAWRRSHATPPSTSHGRGSRLYGTKLCRRDGPDVAIETRPALTSPPPAPSICA